jgi:hypothetical protein
MVVITYTTLLTNLSVVLIVVSVNITMYPEYEGSKYFWTACTILPDYTELHSKTQLY